MPQHARHAQTLPSPDVSKLPLGELQALAAAANEAATIERILAKSEDNPVSEYLRGATAFYEWDHYPPGDTWDPESGAQAYYHAHEAKERFAGEHGHFHTFLRIKSEAAGRPDLLSHLVAIAMTEEGGAFRLFTVNRWVTDENLQPAQRLIPLLDRFRIELARPSLATNRWLGAMLRTFRPQVVALLRARDQVLADWQKGKKGQSAEEDRALQVTSMIDVSLPHHLAALNALLATKPGRKTPAG